MSFYEKFPQDFKDYLKTKYGTNRWWLSEDPLTLAYFQMNDRRLAIPIGKLQWAVEQVLERPIYTHQFGERKTLEREALYNKNLDQRYNLCYEDILELVNKKWNDAKQ